jgi:DNA-binding MarR family transcriptional regulator
METRQNRGDETGRAEMVARVRGGHDQLMHRLAEMHATEFLEIGISMPQAKLLYLVASVDGMHMSTLAARLHVTLSTVSGAVDRLVDQGLASRHDDPADRRQVVVTATSEGSALIERFRELSESQLAALLDALDDRQLGVVAEALEALAAAALAAATAQAITPSSPATATQGDRP